MKSALQNFFIIFISIISFSSCQNEVAQIINAATHAVPVANAGPSKTIQLPINTDTLRGAGSSANGPISGYLWSLVSGPNNPVIVSPSARTTVINNLVAGNYIFQFAVIDSAGFIGVDTVTLKVIPAIILPQQTLTLQPSNNQNEFHFFGGQNIDLSGHAAEIDAETWTVGGVLVNVRGAVKFDLSSIPNNASIISANLSLFSNPTPLSGNQISANFGTNNAMYLKRISNNWSAFTATWLNQPSTTQLNQILIPHTNLPFFDLINIDVKNLVSDMQTSGNNGFMISLQNEVAYNSRIFSSSYYSDSTKHPKLVVVYQ
jgi:hypothetical protein